MDGELKAVIEKDRNELIGNFCRACGYCMPLPRGHRHQPVRPHEPAHPPQPLRRLAHPESQAMMMKIEGLPPLRPMQEKMSLRPGHPHAAGAESGGLQEHPGGKGAGVTPFLTEFLDMRKGDACHDSLRGYLSEIPALFPRGRV